MPVNRDQDNDNDEASEQDDSEPSVINQFGCADQVHSEIMNLTEPQPIMPTLPAISEVFARTN